MSILAWVGIVLGILVTVFVVLPIAWLVIRGSRAEGISADIVTPRGVPRSRPFDMVVTIKNHLNRSREFRSIDFDNSLLKGFAIETLEPEPTDRSKMLGTTAYHYDGVPVPPRGSLTLTLRCRSLAAGNYSGNVAIYADRRHTNSHDQVLTIAIT